jgi:hypothetical protein
MPCSTAHWQMRRLWQPWEGRDLGGVRVLLSSPRWERRLVGFLELSGVGRAVEGAVDVDEARAALSFAPSLFLFTIRRTHTSGLAHSTMLGAENLFCWSSPAEVRELVSKGGKGWAVAVLHLKCRFSHSRYSTTTPLKILRSFYEQYNCKEKLLRGFHAEK